MSDRDSGKFNLKLEVLIPHIRPISISFYWDTLYQEKSLPFLFFIFLRENMHISGGGRRAEGEKNFFFLF